MEYVIGVDGGGTKTAVALAGRDGTLLAQTVLESISYREHGMDAVASRLRAGAGKVLEESGVPFHQVRCAAVGAPGYGENEQGDQALRSVVKEAFPDMRTVVVNDAQIACYGALSGRPGINIVAGTGAIAYGEDGYGASARSGGWSEQFSDEGSCYWLGKMAMGLFCKEADGRVDKGPLYELLKEKLALADDLSFIVEMEKEYLPYRDRTARLQVWLFQAAQEGDKAAQELYRQACRELAQLADAVRGQLRFPGEVPVSLTGGLTHCGTLVTKALKDILLEKGMAYRPCEGSPLEGAVRLACRELESGTV